MKHRASSSHPKPAPTLLALLAIGLLGLTPWRLTARAMPLLPGSKPPDAFTPGGNAGGKLRYGWKTGESYVYSVKIDSEEPDYDETLQGNATYTARTAEDDTATLTCHGALVPIRRSRDGHLVPGSGLMRLNTFGFGGFGRGRLPFGNPNEIKIDAVGHILSTRGSGTDLPRALGDLNALVIETLGDGATWEVNAGCNIVLETTKPLSPFSHFGRTETRNLPATEHTVYTLGPTTGHVVEIDKHYEMRTNERNGEFPSLEMVGDGKILFDTAAGVPQSMTFKVTLTDHLVRNTTVETPVTVTYKLLEGDERERALHPLPPPKVERKPLPEAERAQVLADLGAADNFKKMNAANRLAQAEPDSRRAEIDRALEALLTDKDGFVRTSAVKALAVWGDKTSVPPLIRCLDDESFGVRWAVLDALGSLKDPRAAEPVARALKKDRDFAGRTLKAIGPPAVPAVLPYLKDEDWGIRLEACHILKEIGTKASVSALEAAGHDSNGLVSGAAQEALKAIAAR